MLRTHFVGVLITLGGLTLAGTPQTVEMPVLTNEQHAFVAHGLNTYQAHGLEVPDITFVFHEDLTHCGGHKGMYYSRTETIAMCSLDEKTLLHELAHAWARSNLTEADREALVESWGLPSWNDHQHPWELRGTEHVAETLAWALHHEPTHVKWIETAPDGSKVISHRILTIGVDVEVLIENFRSLTGQEPMFRHPGEWSMGDESDGAVSPEARRFGG